MAIRIHKAAIAAKILIQIAPRARKNLPEVLSRDFHYFRTHLVADAEDLTQHKNQPLATVKAKQSPDCAVVPCLLDQHFHRNRHGSRVRRVKVRNLTQSFGSAIKGANRIRHLPRGLVYVDQMIRCNAVEPRSELALSAKSRKRIHCADENILRCILGVYVKPRHAHRQIEYPKLMPREQQFKRLAVA